MREVAGAPDVRPARRGGGAVHRHLHATLKPPRPDHAGSIRAVGRDGRRGGRLAVLSVEERVPLPAAVDHPVRGRVCSQPMTISVMVLDVFEPVGTDSDAFRWF